MVDDVGLRDLSYKGADFTWFNGREKGAEMWERMDRCFATDSWRIMFEQAQVVYGFSPYSEHLPLKLFFQAPRRTIHGRGQRRNIFRFETLWAMKNACEELIKNG